MCSLKCRAFICHLLANRDGFIVPSCRVEDISHYSACGWRQRFQLAGTSDIGKGFLFSAPDITEILPVPHVRRSVIRVEFQGFLVLRLSPDKIPVILRLIAAQNGVKMG